MWRHYKINDGAWLSLEEANLSGGFYVIMDELAKMLQRPVLP